MIEYVRLWESELLAGRNLPSICVVTGEDAVTWETCCYEFQRGEGGAPDIRSTGELPVSARVRHRSLLTVRLPKTTSGQVRPLVGIRG